jgi:hypothetical protein
MSKQVMALALSQPQGGFQAYTYILWFPVPVGKELPQPQFRSAWPDINSKDPALVTALQQGTMIEEVYGTTLPASLTSAQLQVVLQAAWSSRSAYLAGVPPAGSYYGFFFDGTTWTKA